MADVLQKMEEIIHCCKKNSEAKIVQAHCKVSWVSAVEPASYLVFSAEWEQYNSSKTYARSGIKKKEKEFLSR